jgi:hypothetical protein
MELAFALNNRLNVYEINMKAAYQSISCVLVTLVLLTNRKTTLLKAFESYFQTTTKAAIQPAYN